MDVVAGKTDNLGCLGAVLAQVNLLVALERMINARVKLERWTE